MIASICGPTEGVLAQLKTRYGEEPLYHAVMPAPGGDTELTITVSTKGNTWTALIENPKGLMCVVAVGSNWEAGLPL
jgi:hypothetical protein